MLVVDDEADAGYVRLTDAAVARTEQFSDSVIVDLDAAGSPVGIDILTLTAVVDVDGICDRYSLTDEVRAAELQRVFSKALE